MNRQIQQILAMLNMEVSLFQQRQLVEYVSLLQEYNQKLNLISRRDIHNIWENHIYPSILVNNFVDFPLGVAVADLGSGGGLPGIPLKIIRPDLNLVLIDSSRKKTAFLRQVVHILDIKNTRVLELRLMPREEVDILQNIFGVVMARAVTGFRELWGLARPLLAKNGFLVAWKGESDLAELEGVVHKLGLNYRVVRIPDSLWKFSAKLQHLCYVQLWSESVKPKKGV